MTAARSNGVVSACGVVVTQPYCCKVCGRRFHYEYIRVIYLLPFRFSSVMFCICFASVADDQKQPGNSGTRFKAFVQAYYVASN